MYDILSTKVEHTRLHRYHSYFCSRIKSHEDSLFALLRLGFLEDGAAGELELLGGVGSELANGVLHEVVVGAVLVSP